MKGVSSRGEGGREGRRGLEGRGRDGDGQLWVRVLHLFIVLCVSSPLFFVFATRGRQEKKGARGVAWQREFSDNILLFEKSSFLSIFLFYLFILCFILVFLTERQRHQKGEEGRGGKKTNNNNKQVVHTCGVSDNILLYEKNDFFEMIFETKTDMCRKKYMMRGCGDTKK